MKLTRSNGLRLEVWDVSDAAVLVLVSTNDRAPLPIVDSAIEDDDAARDRVRDLLSNGLARKVK